MSDRRYVEVEDCVICNGSGWHYERVQAWSVADTMVEPERESCEDCRGTGVVPKPGAEPFSGIEGDIVTSSPIEGGGYEIILISDEPAETVTMHGMVLLAGIGGGGG